MTKDAVSFIQHKWDWYERANSMSGHTVDLDYETVTFTGVLRHTALYNGLSGGTVYGEVEPGRPQYFWANYGDEYTGFARNGMWATTLKVMQWEIDRWGK